MSTATLEQQSKAANGQQEQRKRPKNRGNFANDPTRAREAGRKCGRARGKNRQD